MHSAGDGSDADTKPDVDRACNQGDSQPSQDGMSLDYDNIPMDVDFAEDDDDHHLQGNDISTPLMG